MEAKTIKTIQFSKDGMIATHVVGSKKGLVTFGGKTKIKITNIDDAITLLLKIRAAAEVA